MAIEQITVNGAITGNTLVGLDFIDSVDIEIRMNDNGAQTVLRFDFTAAFKQWITNVDATLADHEARLDAGGL